MADSGNGKKLGFDVGFDIDSTSGIQELTQRLEQLNNASKNIGSTVEDTIKDVSTFKNKMDEVVSSVGKVKEAAQNSASGISNDFNNGLLTVSETIERLQQRKKELDDTLQKEDKSSDSYKQNRAELGRIEELLTSITKLREKGVESAVSAGEREKQAIQEVENATKQQLQAQINQNKVVETDTINRYKSMRNQWEGMWNNNEATYGRAIGGMRKQLKELNTAFGETNSDKVKQTITSVEKSIQSSITRVKNDFNGIYQTANKSTLELSNMYKSDFDKFKESNDKKVKAMQTLTNEEKQASTLIKNQWATDSLTAGEAIDQLSQKVAEFKRKAEYSPDSNNSARYTQIAKNYQNVLNQIEREVNSTLSKSKRLEGDYSDYVLTCTKSQLQVAKSAFSEEAQAHSSMIRQEEANLSRLQSKVQYSSNAMKQLVNEQLNVSNMAGRFRDNFLRAFVKVSGIRQLIYGFQQLSQEIIDVNYNVVNNQRLMGDWSDSLRDSLNNSAAEMAKNTGILITDAQEIQGAWIRINDQYAQSPELLEKISTATAKFMNVGEIDDAEEAVKLLNSTILQFGLNTDEAIQTLDKWAYMADKTAMGTADEFGESMSKIGGFMSELGGSVDDAIVMTSILGDRLAKSGDEAGNSIKTILSYLTRTKTITLFDQIVQQTGDASYSLKKANGEFKDFSDLMATASKAYNDAVKSGNDAMAKSIQEAIGATRQGDVAVTLLKNWSEKAPDYYKMINDSISGETSYLDEQNQKLMETFKNQANSLYTSIVQAGTALMNSGFLTSLTQIMGVLQKFFDVFSQLDPNVRKTVVSLGSLVVAFAALNKIGEVTGLQEKFNNAIKYGSEASIKTADNLRQLIYQEVSLGDEMVKSSTLTGEQVVQFARCEEQFNALNNLYNEGIITADEYAASCKKIRESLTDLGVSQQLAKTKQNELNAAFETGLDENEITNRIKESKQEITGFSQAASKGLSNIKLSFTGFKNMLANGASSLKGMLLDFIASGQWLVMAIPMAVTGVVKVIKSLGEATQREGEELDKAKSNLQDLSSQYQEILSKIEEGKGTEQDYQKLKQLKAQITLEERITEEKQRQYDIDRLQGKNVFDKNKSLIGQSDKLISTIKEEENAYTYLSDKANQYSESLNKYLKKQDDAVDSTDDLSDSTSKYARQIESLSEKRNKAFDNVNKNLDNEKANIEKLINIRNEIQDGLDSEIYTGDEADKAQKQVDKINKLLQQTKKLGDGKYEEAEAEAAQQAAIDKTTAAIKDQSSTIDDLSSVIDEYNKNGFLTQETVAGLIQKNSSYAQYLTKENGQYKLNNKAIQDYNQSKKDQADSIDELIKQNQKEAESAEKVESAYKNAFKQSDKNYDSIKKNFSGISGVDEFVSDLKKINDQLANNEIGIEQYGKNLSNTISKNSKLLTNATKSVSGMLSKEQNKNTRLSQQLFTSITNDLQKVMSTSYNAFKKGQISARDYWKAIKTVNQNELQLLVSTKSLHKTVDKGQTVWEDSKNKIDDTATKLESTISAMNAMDSAVDFLSDNYSELSRIQAFASQSMVDNSTWSAEQQSASFIQTTQAFNNCLVNMHDNNRSAWNAIINAIQQAQGQNVTINTDAAGNITNMNQLSAAAVSAGTQEMIKQVAKTGVSAEATAGDVFQKFATMIQGFDYTISARPSFHISKIKDAIKVGDKGIDLSLPSFDIDITGKGDGKVQDFADSLNNLGTSLIYEGAFNSLNLNSFKPTSSLGGGNNGIFSDWSPAPVSGGSSGYSSGNDKAEEAAQKAAEKAAEAQEKAAREQEEAAEKAKQAAEEAKQKVEELTEKYRSNVTSMFERVISALQAKYQDLYDQRKKQLEEEKEAQLKVHNDRIAQLQKELDEIDGDTIASKEAQLADLQAQLVEWQQDTSSLGMSKQKEISDNIADLTKEIKEDKINEQIDKENDAIDKINDHYDKLEDQDSSEYDSVLKSLDDKMKDKSLADEAANMIRKNQLQEIINLIGKYDLSDEYKSYAYLTGQTAGEIMGREVQTALANFKDLLKGTITVNGGTNTNASNNGSIKADVSKFATGGYVGNNEGLAYIDTKERILSAEQTRAFDNLVFNLMPKLNNNLSPASISNSSSNSATFNKELVSVNIGKVENNRKTDIKDFEKDLNSMVKRGLRKSGFNPKI